MKDKSMVHPVQKFPSSLIEEVIAVCKHLKNQKNITPKTFMHCYFLADNMDLAYRRRKWGTSEGWPSSLEVLLSIRKLAKRIVQSQDPPKGMAPQGSYYSSGDIKVDFFEEEKNHTWEKDLQTSMPFLYKLINAKILSSIQPSDNEEVDTDQGSDKESAKKDDGELGDEVGDELENVEFAKPKTHQNLKTLQAQAVSSP
ncbi:uncharacterized protein MELLADRAFT_66124 [Melampsora larici-populina 98AG31]|uniref:Uncharacterized protein n=1 Tax=Melampsora larici-populina (strain 98AG31 / pathotype 3-4-7) TaxID=747676 RepID=F4RXZ0_MELLP|nr:uncharacterized protein MELLADRAFT_66124 [Melampsora larici-populina 98AG31]EGG02817.1 hypothetical protein MELLADRAFT_66124 [Melampsora larici-populina 98AG31]